MKRFWIPFVSLFCSIPILFAQVPITKQLAPLPTTSQSAVEASDGKPYPVHVTDQFLSSAEGQVALRNFHTLRDKGLLPASKSLATLSAVGDTLAFKVLNIEKSTYETLKFRLEFTNTTANLWVSLDDLKNEVIGKDQLVALEKAFFESTPLDSKKGIIDTDITLFGTPPNSDGDGKIDFLWYDIRDGYNGTTSLGFTEGFFSPSDLLGGGSGNNKDILHLDTYPTLKLGVSEVAQTVAHELQHLIHANYDATEDLFVNEGLSEWAEVYMGYRGRAINYFNTESNTTFTQFRQKSDFVFNDYQRGGLFSTYLADQYGAANVGTITRDKKHGMMGFESFLAKYASEYTVSDVMLNFHTANYLNDTALNKTFGYVSPQRITTVQATPSVTVDGALSTATLETTLPKMQAGGMYYLRWKNVQDFTFGADVAANGTNTLAELRAMIRIRAITKDKTGAIKTTDFSPSTTKNTLSGTFSEVTLIVAHIQPNTAKALLADVKYSASWKNDGSTANLVAETVKYDTNDTIATDDTGGSWFFTIGTATGKQATRFIKPQNTVRLHKFWVANYYKNQFAGVSGVDQTSPRDFRLSIWKNNATKTLPGAEIFGVDMKDNRSFFSVSTLKANYQEIDLSGYASQLSALPDTVYIGISEIGTDQNYMVIAPMNYTKENVSFIAGNTQWFQLSGTTLNEGIVVPKTVLGMQAQFLVQKIVANENVDEVPSTPTLAQNFPNPFNPSTSITYSIPRAAPVKLTVYDMLGRQVETLVNQNQVAGEYSALWETKNQASGVYLYVLEVGDTRLVQKMILMK
jgi:hypothetical protein